MALLLASSFDGGDAHDDTGNGRNGTPAIGVSFNPSGHTGKSVVAAGSSNANVVTYPSSGLQPTTAITVMGWFKRSGGGYHHLLVGKTPTAGAGFDSTVGIWGGDSGDSKPSFAVGTGFAKTATTMDTGWHHVAGTYDGANIKLYIDGALAATTAHTGAIGSWDATKPWCVFNSESGAGFFSDAECDDFRIYDTALTLAEVGTAMTTPVVGSGGSALTATASASPSAIYTTGTSTVSVATSGGSGAYTYTWSCPGALTGTFATPDQPSSVFTPSGAAGVRTPRCTVTRGSETVTADTMVTVSVLGASTGVASIDATGWTILGPGPALAMVSDADPATGLRSADNPVAQVKTGTFGPTAAPPAGSGLTFKMTCSRFESTSGSVVCKLYEGATLRSTVTVALPLGATPGQATTVVSATWPAADLAAIAWPSATLTWRTETTVS